ncbi:MAG: DUF4230 domain-containing protein [Anaerolineales bacterium]|nr:DUF4230 domain-containing protein [Anaerolineales bacterium]MCB0019916.1 DUF4230 domain-containing protein [Anaerolineales bacterium]
MMRKAAYAALIIFFLVASFGVYAVVTGLNKAGNAITDPIDGLVAQLSLEATPEILPNPVTIVLEINSLARLETASMSLEKIVTIEKNQEQLFGVFGESILFVAYGDVYAGVDLAKMQPADMQVVDPTTVMVHLPDAEIFIATLDNERSYVHDRDRGLFASADPELETLVRQDAERQILEASLEAGILDAADENAREYMKQFLGNLGFENVIFTDSPPPPPPAYEQPIPKGYFLGTPEPGGE